MTTTAELYAGSLVPSVHVDSLLAQRAKIAEMTRQALEQLVEADRLAVSAGFNSLWRQLTGAMDSTSYCRFMEDGDPVPEIMRHYDSAADAEGWRHLLDASGLRTFMDKQAREEWNEGLARGQAPSFTGPNIEATFSTLYAARGDMFERGVLKVFRSLSWDYKTNLPHRFGKRLIVKHVVNQWSTGGGAESLDDLLRALCVFDGVPEPDHRQSIARKVSDARRERVREIDAGYFSLRWFKNGNGHVQFARMDLVDKLNAVLAKHYPGALPAAG